MADSAKSPFAELSFSEQQEQWRVFRSQHLDFQQVPPAAASRPKMPAYMRENAPQHHNLDRVRAQLAQASRRAGAFKTVTSKE